MGKLDFESALLKKLARQLAKRFPSAGLEKAAELESCSFDAFEDMTLYSCLNSTIQLDDERKQQKISSELYGATLRTYMNRFRQANSQVFVDDLCAELNIQRTYLYKIFRGERRPSRDLAIAFCFVFKINAQECQDLILLLGDRLNDYIKKDFIILYGLNHGLSLDEINEALVHYESDPLTELVDLQEESHFNKLR